ncbi:MULTISPECIES: hypothetical protein [unclassified Sphingobium]|uniref:hypothetical protein n=1 Tax=unclassified Sphingobium TaxID=2611147 RepID=UPI00191A714C|nr:MULTISPECIES: hypothetical protein [unclassified Sphingobium]CAD7335215.1 hypothetical protein SPHS8_00395 [Sphingobium sp. S8]CAD7335234.1 hypothetical protein SPHS6_00395 [Sphingobium sp. S6]CAD7335313.1 hypothetical protein SPHS8_00444 [Sphingobium sp. S8]
MPRSKAPAWTSQEIAILQDIYPREGINGAADALPDRSWQAIYVMASKLGIRSSVVTDAPKPALAGPELEEAIRLREQEGWSFARIGAHLGVCESSACNAVLIALCPRKGFTPAQRDNKGRLTAEGLERLRLMLRKGMKAVDIQLQLGLSASRIAEERRRYRADLRARGKAPLPQPGGGEAYSGVKLTKAARAEVEQLLLQGYGAQKVTERTGVSNTSVGRIRNRLIRRLRRKGETLPGCDRDGRRVSAAKVSKLYIPAEAVEALRQRILAREPVARAAAELGIGGSSAYKIRDALAAELRAQGEELPAPIRLGRGKEARSRAASARWLPKGQIHRFRQLSIEHGHDQAKRMILEEIAEEKTARVSRKLTFEEQLAAVREGKATITTKFQPTRRAPDGTLGGVATGML